MSPSEQKPSLVGRTDLLEEVSLSCMVNKCLSLYASSIATEHESPACALRDTIQSNSLI